MKNLKDFQKKNGSKVKTIEAQNEYSEQSLNFVDTRDFNSPDNCLIGVVKAIKETKQDRFGNAHNYAILADGTAFQLTGNLKKEIPSLIGKEICIYFKDKKKLDNGFDYNIFEINYCE